MKKTIITLLLSTAITATAQQNDVAVKTGEFSGDWQSLSAWECPEWFKDAKFGIWALSCRGRRLVCSIYVL